MFKYSYFENKFMIRFSINFSKNLVTMLKLRLDGVIFYSIFKFNWSTYEFIGVFNFFDVGQLTWFAHARVHSFKLLFL